MSRKWRIVSVALVLVLVIAGFSSYQLLFAQRDGTIHADASDRELVSAGSRIYKQQCASCHGKEREGQPNWQSPLPTGGRPAPPHDGTGHTWHHPDALLFEITKYGGQAFSPPEYKNNMPGFDENLTDREILAVLAFIKSTWPQQIQTQQESINRRVSRQ